jgi:hypothetical protein
VTTLLVVGGSDGSRRCDAKCHEAASIDCDCVCGGRYHALGAQGALEQIRVDLLGPDAESILAELEQRSHELGGPLEVRAREKPRGRQRLGEARQLTLDGELGAVA